MVKHLSVSGFEYNFCPQLNFSVCASVCVISCLLSILFAPNVYFDFLVKSLFDNTLSLDVTQARRAVRKRSLQGRRVKNRASPQPETCHKKVRLYAR